jgi:hypothetical protein
MVAVTVFDNNIEKGRSCIICRIVELKKKNHNDLNRYHRMQNQAKLEFNCNIYEISGKCVAFEKVLQVEIQIKKKKKKHWCCFKKCFFI